ncbi:conserved hypothetical protein [Tenacibaculum amylolyticum]
MYVSTFLFDFIKMASRNRFILLFVLMSFTLSSQNILGKWRTIHEKTGKPISIVELYEENGKVFGKIVEILEKEHEHDLCTKCDGNEKNSPILGLTIIKNMEKVGNYYKKGTIFHPVMGRKFRCRIKFLNDPDKIQVRGYFLFLYGTQYWERIK